MKYGSVIVQQMRNQLLRIDRCALRKLIQRNPAEVQINSLMIQFIISMKHPIHWNTIVQ